MSPIKLFICHSSKDKPFVRRLKKELTSFRLDVWVDENEIKVGDSIFSAIANALKQSDYVLLIISPNFGLSQWAQTELESAFGLEITHKTKKILPCLIKETELPLLISGRKYANFSKKFRNGLIELVDAIVPKNENNPLDVYVTDSVVTLDVQSKDGKLVKYDKKCTHNSLVDNLTHYGDCFAIDGSIENIIVNGQKVKIVRKESGMKMFDVIYSKPLSKGESEFIHTTADLLNSFEAVNEHWETLTNNHNADQFKVIVKFPETRPPVDWYVEERIGTKYTRKGPEGVVLTNEGNRKILTLTINNPTHFVGYFLRWVW
jgi:hypothetical protein